MPRARASRQLDVTDVADELTFPSLDLSVPQIGDTPWTDQQFTMAFSAVGVIRAKALLDKDEGLRAWRTFGADDATAGVELLRGLYGTLQMLGPLPLMAVDWRHEKSLVAVLESLMELFQSSFISDGDLIDTQKDVLRAKSQVMATALVRSRTFDAIARLVAPSGGVRFRSNEAKRSICRSLGEMLSWLFRVVQRIQQEVNDGKYAAAHAAAQAAAAAAGPSSSSSSAGSSVRGTAGAEDLHPELSPDGKRSVLAEQVVAAVQRSGILEHLAAAVLQLTVGQAPAHEDSFSPALEAIALAEPSAEAKSSNGRMQSLVLDALEFFSACNSVLLSVVSPEEEAAQRLPANPFGVCVQWYLTSHVLAQLAASELHSMMVPYRLMAAERSIAPAAAARRAVAAAGESGGPVPALTSVSEWAQAHSLPHEAAALSGLLEVTALNLELYGLDADEALPHPVVEGCGGCKEVNCAGGVPLLRVRTIINTLRSWVRTVLEPEAHAEPGPVTGKDASAPGGPNQRFHLISNRGKIALAKRVAQTALERWLDIDERTEAEKVAKLGPAGQDPAAAAGPSGGQPPQQPQTAAPAPEPKRTKPLTQKELRQQAAAAKKAQTQAPKKGGGGSGGAASASERARKETEEKQQEKIKQAWLLGGFPPQACAGLAVTSLMTAYTLHDFAAIRHVLEVHRHLEEVEQYKQLQLEGANAGAEARGGCCGGGGAGGGGNAPAATAVAYVHGVARASEGGTGAEAPPALPAGILMQYLPEPSSMLLPQSWWTGALQCLDLLARLGPGDDSVQVGAVFSELMKSVLSGASSPRFEFFRRMHSRTSLGDQCSDVRQEGDQVDTFIAAMHQASLRRGLQLGLVPALEAMARQLARTPHPGGSTVTAAVLGAASRWDYLEQLLWQAPLEEAAALIVTLAKVAAKQFSHAMSVAASAKGTWSTTGLDATKAVLAGAADLQLQASEDAIASMMGVGAPADGSGGAGAEGEAPQGQHRNIGHRAGLLSLGLASWLPAARHMLDCLDEIALAKLVTLAFTHGWTGLIASIRDLLCTALDWVPVLVQAGLLAELQGDALMAASWNAFVLRGMGPAQLMRKCATLCQLGVIVRGGPQERMVVRSAEVLAAVYPQELKQVSLPDWWQLAGSEAAAGAAATSDVLERLMCSPVTAGNVLAGSLTALLPPALVRNRAGVCANLGCGCIRGPSDRDVPLTVVCSGCRVSRYCSQHCLEQHASDYDHTPEVCALIKDAAADVARK